MGKRGPIVVFLCSLVLVFQCSILAYTQSDDDAALYQYLNERTVESMEDSNGDPLQAGRLSTQLGNCITQLGRPCVTLCASEPECTLLKRAPALTNPGAVMAILLLIAGMTWAINHRKK